MSTPKVKQPPSFKYAVYWPPADGSVTQEFLASARAMGSNPCTCCGHAGTGLVFFAAPGMPVIATASCDKCPAHARMSRITQEAAEFEIDKRRTEKLIEGYCAAHPVTVDPV